MGHRQKRIKGYWTKCTEKFDDGMEAKSRTGHLRDTENLSHVTVDKEGERYVVSYSVAKWYLDELNKIGVKL